MAARPRRPRRPRDPAPRSLDQTLDAAERARAAGRLADSFAACSQVLTLEPGHVGALHCLSRIAREHGDTDAAMDFIAAACRKSPQASELHLECARVHIARGDLPEAERALRVAIENGGGTEPRLALVDLLLVERRFAEALPLAEALVAACPSIAAGFQRLGHLHRELGAQPAAMQAFGRAIELDPTDATSLFEIARQWLALGQTDSAAAALRRCLQLDPLDSRGARALLGEFAAPVPAPASPVPATHEEAEALRHARRMRCLVERATSLGRRRLVTLELGCGAGGAGTVWRRLSEHLIAVEADEGDADAARRRGIYDVVNTASPAQHLAELPAQFFDLVAAPVALTRSHALSPFFAGASRTLRRGGLFAVALHADARGTEITILPGQRFRHSDAYLRRLADAYGFEMLTLARLQDRARRNEGSATLLALMRSTGPRE
ncbi:MAG: tetratricopeptide repeat protein [Alphaproteobacteria bacterium]|nr:tetratricopeptide repeat protein [Alphaproteobacteria bacterium]